MSACLKQVIAYSSGIPYDAEKGNSVPHLDFLNAGKNSLLSA